MPLLLTGILSDKAAEYPIVAGSAKRPRQNSLKHKSAGHEFTLSVAELTKHGVNKVYY
jgi:hypothetical protein